MRTKEEYYQSVIKCREIISDPENQKCSCPKIRCERHGKCKECVTLHRFFQDHIPNCFQTFIKDHIVHLSRIVELSPTEKEKIPPEYWDYVKEQDQLKKSEEDTRC
jgi:hypothetical protein